MPKSLRKPVMSDTTLADPDSGPTFHKFLALPTELRLMIYDRIPPTNQHLVITTPKALNIFEDWINLTDITGTTIADKTLEQHPIIFVFPRVSNAIRATCRRLNSEARNIIAKRNQHLDLDEVKMMVNGGLWEEATTGHLAWTHMPSLAQALPRRSPRHTHAWNGHSPANLKTFADAYARLKLAKPHTPISISLYGYDIGEPYHRLEMTNQSARRSAANPLLLRLGAAGPQYFPNDEEWLTCERDMEESAAYLEGGVMVCREGRWKVRSMGEVWVERYRITAVAETRLGFSDDFEKKVEEWNEEWEEDRWFDMAPRRYGYQLWREERRS